MALNEQERQRVLELKEQGYTLNEIQGYLGGERLNRTSTIRQRDIADFREQEQGVFKRILADIPQDLKQGFQGVKDAFSGGVETATEAREQVTSGDISPVAGTVKTIGGGLEAGAEAVGEGLMSLLRLPFTQQAEGAVGEKVEHGVEAVAQTEVVQEMVARYESLSDEQKAIVDGVLGTAEGAAVLMGAGPATKALNKTFSSASQAVKTGARRIGNEVDELAKKGVTLPSTAGISQAVDLGLKPEDIMQRVARISKGKQAKFEQRAGESVGSYLVSRNIFGTPDQIVDQLYSRMKESKSRVDASLESVPGTFKAPVVKTALDELIERDTRVSTSGALSPDSKKIEELYKKYNQKGLTLSEVNAVKRLYERNVRVDYLSFGNPQADKLARANNIDSGLRNLVEDKAAKSGVDTVKELNKETALARQLLDDLGAEYAGSAGNNAIGLTDALFLAEAAGGSPTALAGFVAKKTLSSKPVMSKVAQMLSPNAGSKAELPLAPLTSDARLTGYLKFLDDQKPTGTVQ